MTADVEEVLDHTVPGERTHRAERIDAPARALPRQQRDERSTIAGGGATLSYVPISATPMVLALW